ncbi:MAG: ABC transporter ATP-binding protein [Bacillaceae bacterium]
MDLIWSYVKKYKLGFSLSIFALMIEAGCDLLLPTLMARMIDVGVANQDLDYVFKTGLMMLAIAAIGAGFAFMRNILSSIVSQRIGENMRSDIYEKIQFLSFETINKWDRASLVTRLTNDVMLVQNFITGLMRIFVRAPLIGIGSIGMAFILDFKLALILCIIVPIVGLLIYGNVHLSFPLFTKVQHQLDHVNRVIREYLSGVRVVRAFNRFNYETKRLKKENTNYVNTSIRVNRIMAFFSPSMNLMLNIGIVVVLWIGGYQVNNGDVYVGKMIAFVNYMTQILFALMMIQLIFNNLIRAKASAIRINEILKEENTVYSQSLPLKQINDIAFSNVSFTYHDGNNLVLKDISFHCKKGTTLGIIGSIGSGKSTILQLIPRFYETTSGTIEINGQSIAHYTPKDLREKIAIVPQKSILLSGTILENLLFGNENGTLEEVVAAAKVAQAHEFIMKLPHGYHSIVDQQGVNLSGGQKQRMAIARALLRKPDVLLLDDCTSAIDVATEQKILNELNNYCKDITVILVSQRLSTVKKMDQILVLDYGKVESCGTHEYLIAHSHVYREIYESQVGKEVAHE